MFFDQEQLKQENQIHFLFYFPFWNLREKNEINEKILKKAMEGKMVFRDPGYF